MATKDRKIGIFPRPNIAIYTSERSCFIRYPKVVKLCSIFLILLGDTNTNPINQRKPASANSEGELLTGRGCSKYLKHQIPGLPRKDLPRLIERIEKIDPAFLQIKAVLKFRENIH